MSKIRYAVLSKQGTYHSINQDYLITPQNIVYDLLKNKGYLFAICDGVGGYEGGEIASNFCCNKLLHDYYNETSIGDIKKWFQNKLHEINKQIILKGEQQNLHRMSTTLTALLIKDELFYTFNIGDSRIYKYEDSTLTQLTDDHSLVWEQYQKNLIDKDDIVNSSIKNLITQAMGFELNIDIQIQKHTLPEKFCLLLCSDGLTDVSIDDEIEMVFCKEHNLENIAKKLYKTSQKNAAHDDVTLIVISNYLEK